MPSVVNGENVILYYKNPIGVFYFNGGISEGTIASNAYAQISTTQNVASSVDFTAAYDNTIARFITDIGKPGYSIAAGTWTFTSYVSITYNLAYDPGFYFKISKYNGTTFTTIATSSVTVLTSNNKTLYTSTISMSATTLSATERLVIEVLPSNVGARDIYFYTQGANVSKVTTTIAYDQVFGASTNCTFDVNVSQIEVTSQTSAWFREYKIDVAGWNISCDGLICLTGYSYKNMLDTQLAKSTIGVKFSIDDGTTPVVITGDAIINSISLTGPNNNTSTYSVSLTGVGAYTIT
jgi:predicted secreted protein